MNELFFQNYEETFKKIGYDVTFQFKQMDEPYRLKRMYFKKGFEELEIRFKFYSDGRDLVFHPNILLAYDQGEDTILSDILLPFLSFIKDYAVSLSIPVVFCDHMFFTKCMDPKKSTYCFEKEQFRFAPQELSKYFYKQGLFSKRCAGWFYCTKSFILPKEYELYDHVYSLLQEKKNSDPFLDINSLLPSTDIKYHYNGYSGFLTLSCKEDTFIIEDEELSYKKEYAALSDISNLDDLFHKITALYRVKNIFHPPKYFYNKYFEGDYLFGTEIRDMFHKELSAYYRSNEIEHYFASNKQPLTFARTNDYILYKIMDVYFLKDNFGEFVTISKNEQEVKQIMIDQLFSTL